ncbi:MAG: DNA topoisomerase 3 [Magnetococcales bacterium]|nr:DNA topoisomerase 3 [Magnetococcales bacterium]
MATPPTLLYLCEKPSQARDIAQILGATAKREGYLEGADCRVTWCLGHLLEMVMPDAYRPEWKNWQMDALPIIPAHWQLAVRQTVAKQFAVIKRLLPQARQVIIATDADREGETIGREVLTQCGYRGQVARLWLSALDDASIRKALQTIRPGQQTEPLYQAGLGRARADWLVGINLSRAYTLLGRTIGHAGVLTVGRVQTPTLKLVVDRDRQIESFQPLPFFDLYVYLRVANGGFRAQWIPSPDEADAEGRCLERAKAEAVASRVLGAAGSIQRAETKRVKEPPPLPLDLSTLQQEGSRRWHMSASRTLEVAQSLYETHKAITYPRTDCRHLPASQWPEAAAILHAIAQADPALAPLVQQADATLRSRAWDDQKITAHHAIIPTGARLTVARLAEDEMRIYDRIRRHYLAQFFPAFEYDHTVIDAQIAQALFRASGRVPVVTGWQQVLQVEPQEKAKVGDKKAAQPLPLVKKGEPTQAEKTHVAEKRTQPPQRFTEGTLIQAMKQVGRGVENPRLKQILRETAGIGTEATRASIIENLLKRQLLTKEGKKNLLSTEAGRLLVDLLPHSVTDPATTAVWEQALDDIANGQGSLAAFQEKTVLWVTRLIGQVQARHHTGLVGPVAGQPATLALDATVAMAGSATLCPRCGRPMRHRQSARGGFWGCSGYPECREIVSEPSRNAPAAVTAPSGAGQTCPQCQTGQLIKRVASQGKSKGQTFVGCNRFPECRFILSGSG